MTRLAAINVQKIIITKTSKTPVDAISLSDFAALQVLQPL